MRIPGTPITGFRDSGDSGDTRLISVAVWVSDSPEFRGRDYNGIKLSGKRPSDARNGLRPTFVARPQGRFSCGHARPEARQDPYLNAIRDAIPNSATSRARRSSPVCHGSRVLGDVISVKLNRAREGRGERRGGSGEPPRGMWQRTANVEQGTVNAQGDGHGTPRRRTMVTLSSGYRPACRPAGRLEA